MNPDELKLLLAELKARQKARILADLQDPLFPEQNAFVLDPARFLAACCTRRAGKTNGLAYRFFRTMQKYPGCFCPYTALTRESAKNIMWPVLQELDEKHKIGAVFTDSNLTMTLPNGSRLQLFGADMKNFIKRLKGIKTPGAGVDEAQDMGGHLASLIDDVLTPATADFKDGWIALTGTPGPIPFGYFYDVTEKKKNGYSLHAWSLFSNPYMPDAAQFVADLINKKGWSEDSPTLLREYRGKWVLDLDALVFKYQAEKNHYDELPPVSARSGDWEYVIGVDLGFNDADAIAVVGWHRHVKEAYLVSEQITAGQGITELVSQIEKMIATYKPLKIVMDTGGLGLKIAEELRKRYSLPIEAAEKARKFEFIELLNDAMRMVKFFAKKDSRFAEDAMKMKWETESIQPRISDHFHSDITDAVLYAYRESLHWLYTPEATEPAPRSSAWMDKQEAEMEQAAEREYQNQKNDDFFNEWYSN